MNAEIFEIFPNFFQIIGRDGGIFSEQNQQNDLIVPGLLWYKLCPWFWRIDKLGKLTKHNSGNWKWNEKKWRQRGFFFKRIKSGWN